MVEFENLKQKIGSIFATVENQFVRCSERTSREQNQKQIAL